VTVKCWIDGFFQRVKGPNDAPFQHPSEKVTVELIGYKNSRMLGFTRYELVWPVGLTRVLATLSISK
jgi:hypothetical protein